MITSIDNYRIYLIESKFRFFNTLEKINEADWSDNSYTPKIEQDIKHDLDLISNLKLTLDKTKEYIYKALDKINKLPEESKIKLFKIVVSSFVAFCTLPTMITTIHSWASKNDIKQETVKRFDDVVKSVYSYKKDSFKYPTEFSDTLVEFLKFEEGSINDKGEPVLTAYDLGDKHITIGYGHTDPSMVANVTKITKDQAIDLLIEDIKEAQGQLDDILNDWLKQGIKIKISQGQYDSMISMIFNMGIGNFRQSDFIQLVKQNKMDEAEKKIKSTNVTYPGHKARRDKESKIFASVNNISISDLI